MQLRKLTAPQARLETNDPDDGVEQKSQKRPSRGIVTVIDASSSHIRVHKSWRWVFIGLFILSKIFLFFAIYYFVMYRIATGH